jgi:hypothetical protein
MNELKLVSKCAQDVENSSTSSAVTKTMFKLKHL